MRTARTTMFSWLPACLEQSALPAFLCCCSCAHEPCSSGQGWCEEQLGEGAGSGLSRGKRHEREDQGQGSVTLDQVAAQGCATSRCLETRHCAEPRRWTFAAQREGFRATETTTHTATTCGICYSNGLEAFNASVAAQASGAPVCPMLRVLVTAADGQATWPEMSAESS